MHISAGNYGSKLLGVYTFRAGRGAILLSTKISWTIPYKYFGVLATT